MLAWEFISIVYVVDIVWYMRQYVFCIFTQVAISGDVRPNNSVHQKFDASMIQTAQRKHLR
jgi:hypothetical protein